MSQAPSSTSVGDIEEQRNSNLNLYQPQLQDIQGDSISKSFEIDQDPRTETQEELKSRPQTSNFPETVTIPQSTVILPVTAPEQFGRLGNQRQNYYYDKSNFDILSGQPSTYEGSPSNNRTQQQMNKNTSEERLQTLRDTIKQQTKVEKHQKQKQLGKEMEIKCYQQGRCPMCTLIPPCNHIQDCLLPKTTSIQNRKGYSPFKGNHSRSNSPTSQQIKIIRDSIDSLSEPSAWIADDNNDTSKIQMGHPLPNNQFTIEKGSMLVDNTQQSSKRSFVPVGHQTPFRIIHNPSEFQDLKQERNTLEQMYAGNNYSKSNLTQAMRQLQLKRHLVFNNTTSSLPNDSPTDKKSLINQSSFMDSHGHAQLDQQAAAMRSAAPLIVPNTARFHERKTSNYLPFKTSGDDDEMSIFKKLNEYKEQKIKSEFSKLQQELIEQQQAIEVQQQKMMQHQRYILGQRNKIEEYNNKKIQEQKQQYLDRLKFQQTEAQRRILHDEQIKIKLRDYHERQEEAVAKLGGKQGTHMIKQQSNNSPLMKKIDRVEYTSPKVSRQVIKPTK